MNTNNTPIGNYINLTFFDGPKVEIVGIHSAKYHIKFINNDTLELIYETTIDQGCWAAPSLKYFINWHILVEENGVKVVDYKQSLENKKVFIIINSASLGDSVAWIPYPEEFRKKYNCEVTVSTHWNNIFKLEYPYIKFIEYGTDLKESDYDFAYIIGVFDNNYERNKNNWRLIPLQQVASDMLGLEFEEIKPKIVRSNEKKPIKDRYVAISEFSTFYGKQWLYPNGWQEIVDWLNELGYKVMSISKEPSQLKNIIKRNDKPIEETIRNLQYADFYMGASSGLCVLAWGLDIPSIVISGFTDLHAEMKACYRVVEPSKCHGCFNDIRHTLDRANWRYCPRNNNFECTRSINPQMVKDTINKVITNIPYKPILVPIKKQNILFLTPHCSTGGGPQYWYWLINKIIDSDINISVIEYNNFGGYEIQKRKLQSLCGNNYYVLGDNKEEVFSIINNINPDIIHVQECPEFWLQPHITDRIYNQNRKYKIIETSHSSQFNPLNRQYNPDGYILVGQYHANLCEKTNIPYEVIEYQLEPKMRPDRTFILQTLGVDPLKIHVLHVGLFAPWKNQGEIFEIARNLSYIQFHFVGNQAPNFSEYWKPLMDDKPSNCHIWYEREDIDNFYSSMDLFIFPSTMECNPLVIKEALAWQMPVLMRNLEVYCGSYDNNKLVKFMNSNINETCAIISDMFPYQHSFVKDNLFKFYDSVLNNGRE